MPRLPLIPDPPGGDPPADGPLVDTFGRVHTNLRVSVTDRCNLRCTYCMPEDVTFRDRAELLTFEEIAAVVRAAVPLGVTKVRLTGGEPLVRKDLPVLVRMLADTPGVRDLGLTTNGVLLAEQAAALYAAGLRRLNVSLDTLDPDRFRRVARRDGLDRVLAGLAAAKAAGFAPIKVNAVAVRGLTDADVVPLARFCCGHGFDLRFIEYMPIGAADWARAELLPAADILAAIERDVAPLRPVRDGDPHAPATEYEYADGGRVGVIASVTRPFCGACDRLRLTADGKLRNCLFARDEFDVRPLVRPVADPAAVRAAIRRAVWAKRAGHGIDTPAFVKPDRTMHAIGG